MTGLAGLCDTQPPEEVNRSASTEALSPRLRAAHHCFFSRFMQPPGRSSWLCLRSFGWILPPDWCNTSCVFESLRHLLISCYVSTLIGTSPSFPLGHFCCSTGIVHSCACQCGCLQRHQSQCSRFIKSGLFEKATHVNS
jgi:hypothetical protein